MDAAGNQYLDFLCGAGAVNYGHNHPQIKQSILDYLQQDGVVMGLDLHTQAKKDFIQTFQQRILAPRHLSYKMQFTSPTGTSVVESSIKLARKVTGRQNIVAFTNGYHGMTGVSLSLTGNRGNRQSIAYGPVTRLPYDGYLGAGIDSIEYYRKLFTDNSSGVDLPAAFILETVQGEGGLNVASVEWLRGLSELAAEIGALLIIDDIQAGCGRTGKFFSFERAEIQPDMVCLSKSIGGFGLPMAILLLRDELDKWNAGEDNGTFRGNNLAFVAARRALELYWDGFDFEREIAERAQTVAQHCRQLARRWPGFIKEARGLGLMQGLEFYDEALCEKIAKSCFSYGVIIERCGDRDQVLKIMPALTIEPEQLAHGMAVIERAIDETLEPLQANQNKKRGVAGEVASLMKTVEMTL